MMRSTSWGLGTVLVAFVLGCASQLQVHEFGDRDLDENLIHYTLPRTQLAVRFDLARTQRCPGALSRIADAKPFSEQHPGVRDLGPLEASQSWSVEGVSLLVGQEPDPEAHYVVGFPEIGELRPPPPIELDEFGMLVLGESDEAILPITKSSELDRGPCTSPEYETGAVAEARAEELADRIDDLKDRSLLLISGRGRANLDAAALGLMLERIEQEKASVAEDFLVETRTRPTHLVLVDELLKDDVEASASSDERESTGDESAESASSERRMRLLAIEQDSSLCDPNDEKRDDPTSQEGDGGCWERAVERYELRLKLEPQLPSKELGCGRDDDNPCKTLVYRIPRNATASVVRSSARAPDTTVIVEQRVQIAQLGATAALPDRFAEPAALATARLHPKTGGLRRIGPERR